MMRRVSIVVSLLSEQDGEHEPCRSRNRTDRRKRPPRAHPIVVAIVDTVRITAGFEPRAFRSRCLDSVTGAAEPWNPTNLEKGTFAGNVPGMG
jgi:hypothetical protein